MRKIVNELIPADDLHWDEDEKKHVAVSRQEEANLIRSCLRCGLNEDQTLKLVREYCLSKTSVMLFKNFLEGNIDVYSFTSSGEPIFSKPKKERSQHLEFLFFKDQNDLPDDRFDELAINSVEFRGGYLCCVNNLCDIPFDKIFDTVMSWCSNNGFSLLDGENPDDDSTWLDKDPVETSSKLRTWKISRLEVEKGLYAYVILEVGGWFEFESEAEE